MTPLPGSLGLIHESEIEFRRCFIEDAQTGALRLTSKGLGEYGSRFARAGISICLIKNRQQFRQACNESEWVVWEEIREMICGQVALEKVFKDFFSE
jgi:hypothetical protein